MQSKLKQMDDRITIDDEAVEARLREKAEARMRDFERLRHGEVTAEELQEENSIFPPGWVENCVIEDLYKNFGR